MTTAIVDPRSTVAALIKTDWNDANVLSVTPTFSTGWWDHGNERPQLSFTDHQEFGPGTMSQYSGFMGDGSGPFQRRQGFVWVTAFAVRPADRTVATPNPKTLTWLMAREAMRLVHANVYTALPAGDFDQVASGDLVRDRLPDLSPTVFMAQFPIVYTRTETP
jgi:hypothetical protein